MTKKTRDSDDPAPTGVTVPEPLSRAIGERYLTYALSTIVNRALPDVRDGLKPVHRRIIHAMRELRLGSATAFRKSAKIAGDVMGNYHPHGDAAIYDAMARLAQDFNMRYPLVDGQGNFGNIDGDSPAASRYTEARLTAYAEALMEGLDEDAVDFQPNYDGTLTEPVVMPAALPNLLANGSSGIAVGMATNIPPHNLDELILGCQKILAEPGVTTKELLSIIPGPDFPTGGVLIEPPDAILAAYESGRGTLRLRARWTVEDLGRGQWQVVVTEIPYQVQKSRLIEKIADLITEKRIPLLADIRDESADDIRIVFEPRSRTVDVETLMGILFKMSDLETRFGLNMNVLVDGGRVPRVCGLKEVLDLFLAHRRGVLQRRSTHRLAGIARRLEVVDGFIIAYLNLDRVIDIIRHDDAPRAALMREDWSHPGKRATDAADYVSPPATGKGQLSEVQAEAILDMRLRRLRRLEELALRDERARLIDERDALTALLADEGAQWRRIGEELEDMRQRFGRDAPGGARRTTLGAATAIGDVSYEEMIEREPITVICSRLGWIRALRGHVDLAAEQKFKDGDGPRFMFHAETTDRILIAAEDGRFYALLGADLPGGRGMGEPLRLMIDLSNDTEVAWMGIWQEGARYLVASSVGNGFVVAAADLLAQTRAGKQVMTLRGGARTVICRPVDGDHVAVAGDNRRLLVFPLADLPEMTRGKGVRLQRYRDGGLADARTFSLADGLSWHDPAGRTRTETDLSLWLGARAGAGRMAPHGFPRDNRFN